MFAAAVALTLVADPARPVKAFTLTDPAGKTWHLRERAGKATVVAFLAVDCPMTTAYVPTLSALAKEYAGKGVTLVGIVPDPDTSAARVKSFIDEYKPTFPVLRDEKHAAVKSLGGKTTPEVVVLDAEFVVRYRGRIDDGYVARMKPKAAVTRRDLAVALDEVLAGKPVSVPETKAFGCPVADLETKPAAAAGVTYHKDIVPILQSHCQGCHRPGQVGPFALASYKDASKWADLCVEEVSAKRMPPWKAAPNPRLAGERSLPAAATATLAAWAAAGCPEGDPKDAPPPAKFTDGWTLGQPDLILETPSDVTVDAAGRDLFRVLVFPTNLPEDKYIVAMEVKPGNPRVVHHTLSMIDPDGEGRKLEAGAAKSKSSSAKDRGPGYTVTMGWGFIPDPAGLVGGWAPGMLPKKLPAGVGQKLPKGADVLLQIHYHRTGKVETDRTKIGLYFADKPVTDLYRTAPAAGRFAYIPAGESAFKVQSESRLRADATLYRMVPHMHLLGKDIQLSATVPGGKEEVLVRVPAWDYNWQEQYELKEPLKLPAGTLLKVTATYDNSAGNPHNPFSPPQPVKLGEQTTNEMCFVFLGLSTKGGVKRVLSPVFLR